MPLCAGETVPGAVTKKLGSARTLIARAATTTNLGKAKRWIKKSSAGLRGLQRVISKQRGRKLSGPCADALAKAVDDVLVHTTRWLGAPSLH